MTKPGTRTATGAQRKPGKGRATAKATAAARSTAGGKRRAKAAVPGAYHHGALREALLGAAERILEREGLPGLTLRAAAREAGVSHAAPTHHFGDLTGLLSELAAVGFRRFSVALAAAAQPEASAPARLDAMGRAYVMFARSHPGLFTLMFRSERLDPARPALQEAMTAAGAALVAAVGARRQEVITRESPTLTQMAAVVRTWSMVHGFAVLLLDGRLREFLSRLPPGTDDMALLAAVLTPDAPAAP